MEINDAVSALGALAQATRLSIYRLLVQAGPDGVPVGQIRDALDVPAATLSFHLKELNHAGLIQQRQEGRFIYYSVDFEQMSALMTFLTENCCQGMPQECLSVMETALESCCTPGAPRKSTTRRK